MKRRILTLLLALLLLSFPAGAMAGSLGSLPEQQLGEVAAASVLSLDADSGDVLFEYQPDLPMAPASTMKIMTALMIQEAVEAGKLSLTDEITVTEDMIAATPEDASRMLLPLEPGEVLTLEQLLSAHLLSSDCMASSVLACVLSGTEEAFCQQMEQRARELGCEDTAFTNASGYPDENMQTSARSLAIMALEFLKHPQLVEMASAVSCTIPATNLNLERSLTNTNLLLRETLTDADGQTSENPWYYPAATGLKTGSSTPSGLCLISTAEANGHSIVTVLLGARAVEKEDGSTELPQYTESIRIADVLLSLLEKKDMATEEGRALIQAAADELTGMREGMKALSRADGTPSSVSAPPSAAPEASLRLRLMASGATLAVMLLASIPTELIQHRRKK